MMDDCSGDDCNATGGTGSSDPRYEVLSPGVLPADDGASSSAPPVDEVGAMRRRRARAAANLDRLWLAGIVLALALVWWFSRRKAAA